MMPLKDVHVGPRDLAKAALAWSRFINRTIGFGTVSLALGPPTSGRASQWAMRRWAASSCKAIGLGRELIGADKLHASPQCVFVANHMSHVDILVIASFVPHDYRWLAKDQLFKIPFLGWHLHNSGHIPVYRGDRSRELNGTLPERIHAVVEEGASLLFFPEGTRSKDGRLQDFKKGAFRAAVDEGLPIVPLVVRGTHDVLKKGSRIPQIKEGTTCVVEALDPIPVPAGGTHAERVAELLATTHEAFRVALGEHGKADAAADRKRGAVGERTSTPREDAARDKASRSGA